MTLPSKIPCMILLKSSVIKIIYPASLATADPEPYIDFLFKF